MLWGRRIGAARWDDETHSAVYEFDPAMLKSGVEVSPLRLPLGPGQFRFPELARTGFRGLPGLLADSLPDSFGNAVIDRWLATRGRDAASFSPIERLCYVGSRGMGALEFKPAIRRREEAVPIEIAELVELAALIQRERESFKSELGKAEDEHREALEDILRVGSSAGGARAKAVVAWNPATGELLSGQVAAPEGFEHWLLKFDGVLQRDRELADPAGFGKIEYAYHLMALEAGITMSPSRLLHENGRSHFMTRRFDRGPDGEKRHMQTLCALGHYDFQLAGAHSYEQALMLMQTLRLPVPQLAELFRRMLFNVIARNQDDHTKNVSFLMDKKGTWSLAPAYDLTFAYNPTGDWTGSHQMTIAGKRDDFTREDLLEVGRRFGVPKPAQTLEQVADAVRRWSSFAETAGVTESRASRIAEAHRLELAG
ncbi:MAG: type II toxin-antitoxin system HipA family toxin [Planctomycetes bacterium]|nr:type II toxin-antitoxin system HipA family toxin [Planctomycetota bacterium]